MSSVLIFGPSVAICSINTCQLDDVRNFIAIVPLQSYDEPNVSLIQTTQLVRVSLTGNRFIW